MDSLTHGFTIIQKNNIPELAATGIFARHERTGVEVYHLLTDKEENFFSFGFATPTENAKGVIHALMHMIADGNCEKYTEKNPLLAVLRRNSASYLNAMTYPNFTLYAAASCISDCYFNLMHVY